MCSTLMGTSLVHSEGMTVRKALRVWSTRARHLATVDFLFGDLTVGRAKKRLREALEMWRTHGLAKALGATNSLQVRPRGKEGGGGGRGVATALGSTGT